MRTSVNRQQDRPLLLLALLEAGRLDDPAVDLLALSALEKEVFARDQALALQASSREVRELINLGLPALVQFSQHENVIRRRHR